MKPYSVIILFLSLNGIPNQIAAQQTPIGVATPSIQVVCTNDAITTIVLSTSNGMDAGTTYAWSRTNTINVQGLSASGTGDINGTPLNGTSSSQLVTYTIIPTNDGFDGDPFEAIVIVNPAGQVDDPADQVVCNQEITAAINFTTINIGGTNTYTWTNDTPSIGLVTSGSGNIPSFAAINTGSVPVIATVTVTPQFTNGGVTCEGPTEDITITVNPTAQVNDPPDQVVCNAENTADVIFTTDRTGGSNTYTWTNDTPSIGLATSGSGNIPLFAAINTGSVPVIATVTVTPHFEYGGLTCDGPPETFTIIVNPTAQVDDPADQVLCNTDLSTVSFTTTTSGGTATYTWVNNTPGIGLAASGGGDISFIAVNTSTAPVVAAIIVTPHFTFDGHTCDGPTEEFTITVNPTAQVNDPVDQVVCNTENTADAIFSTDRTGGSYTYTWTNDTPSIGLVASGSGNIPAFAAINAGSVPVIATITVTPHFEYGGLTCDGPPETLTITVNPTAQVYDPADQVVCNTYLTTVTLTTITSGGIATYTWVNDTPGIGLAASGGGNISFNAVNTGTAPVLATIIVTPHFAFDGHTCDGPTQEFTITMNPTAQVNDPVDQVVCNTENTTLLTFTTDRTLGTTTYTWTNDTPSIELATSGSVNIPAFAAINTGSVPVIATITVTPHFTYGSHSCDGPPQAFTITVNPTAQLDDPADQVLCNTENTAPVTFTTDRTLGLTTYTWTNDTPSIGLAASGSGDIPSFVAINSGSSPMVATITVTPHFTYDGHTCDGPMQSFIIIVNPTAQVDDPLDQIVDNGANTATVSFLTDRTGGTTSYTWTNDTPSIGLAPSGSGDIPSFSATNAGLSPVVATITVLPHFANGGISCDGPVQDFTLTINPSAPIANAGLDQEICGILNLSLDGNDPLPGIGTWTQVSGPGTILFGDVNSYNTSVSATIYGTYVLQWAISFDGVTTTDEVTIISNEDPVQASAGVDQILCGSLMSTLEGISHIYQAGNEPVTSTSQWSYVSGPDNSPVFSDDSSPSSDITVSAYGSYVFRWTETNGNCLRIDDVNIDFSDIPNVSGGSDQEVCYGESVTLTGTGDGAISWDQGIVNGTPLYPLKQQNIMLAS